MGPRYGPARRRHNEPARKPAGAWQLFVATIVAVGAPFAPAPGQDATWLATPGSGDFNTGSNWSGGTTPTGTATYGTSNTTSLTFSAPSTTVGILSFANTAPTYSFSLNNQSLTLNGATAPIVTNTVNVPSFSLSNTSSLNIVGGSQGNTSTLGSASITTDATSTVLFNRPDTVTFAGTISGTGTLVQQGGQIPSGGGLLTLTGPNNFAGAISVQTGAVLQLGTSSTSAGIFSGTASLTGGSLDVRNADISGMTTITANSGALLLRNSTALGNTTLTMTNSSLVEADNSSSLGATHISLTNSSAFINGTATASTASLTVASGSISFGANSTAANSTLTVNSSGGLGFSNNSTAGSAAIVNNSGGTTTFNNGSTAGNATITNNAGGLTFFQDTSTAGNATITNSGTSGNLGSTTFLASSSAGSATVTTSNGGRLFFQDTASGGTARFITNGTGQFDISGLSSSATSAGSIEGSGSYLLGSKQLTVGTNNASTEVSGVIADGGAAGGTGGSLVKAGSGTFTLSGTNTYTGPTTISAGTLQLGNGGTTGSIASTGAIVNNATLAFNRSDSVTIAQSISGTGTVVQAGSGTTILTGTNTYAGPTTISAGTLQLGNGGTTGSIASTSAIVNNATLAFNRSDSVTIGQTISGSGAVSQIGSGTTVLTGNNSYTGGTTVSAGTLQVGDGSGAGSIVGNVNVSALAASLVFNASSAGATNITNNGTTSFVGSASAGTSTIANNSTVEFHNTSTAASSTITGGAVNFFDTSTGGTATITTSGVVTFQNSSTAGSATISTSTLMQTLDTASLGNAQITNTSQLQMFNTSTVANATIVNDGTSNNAILAPTDNATLGNAIITNKGSGGATELFANATAANATITNDSNGATAFFNSTTAGSSSITSVNGGSTLFLNTSSAGTATITNNAGGMLQFFDQSTADTATVVNNAGGLVDVSGLSGGVGGAISIGSLSGAGNVTLGNSQLTLGASNGPATISGIISDNDNGNPFIANPAGTGGSVVKVGTGTLILTGDNAYTGGTTIAAGTLQLGNGGTTGSVVGDVLNNGTLAVNRSNTLTIDGTISGTGQLIQQGTGTTILTADNTYTGGTTIGAGTLQLGNGGTTGSVVDDVLNNGTLAVNRSNTLTIDGTISGTGQLLQQGTGTLILTADNTYTGGTTISAGILQLGNGGTAGSILGNILNNSILSTNRSNTLTLDGTISGTGSLQQVGSGTTILTADNTYSGGTTISAGILQLGNGGTSGSVLGNILNNSILSTNRSNTLTLDGTISGTGSLRQTGSGTTVLTADNTYSGGTTISGGTLQLGNGGTTGSVQGAIANNGTLAISRSDTLTLSNSVTGSGSLDQLGPGTLIIATNTTYTGGTRISGGILQLGNGGGTGSVLGAITDNATLAVNRSDTFTLANLITGTGGFQQIGSGTTILTATNTYTGPTAVLSGRLAVNGSITSDVTVGSNGNLGGTGTIFGAVQNNGTITPGNSIGTLTINGSYTQAVGTFYQVELNAAGQSDLIHVTGAPGTATILGGTVNVLAAPGSYGHVTQYTIVTADGGRIGTYAGLTTNFAFLKPSLTYDPNHVFLTLTLDTTDGNTTFSNGGRTPNQRAVGSAFDRSAGGATGDFAAVISALSGLSVNDAPAALDHLGPEPYSGFATEAVLTSRLFMHEVARQMAASRAAGPAAPRTGLAALCQCEAGERWSAWTTAFGSAGTVDGDGNAHTLRYTIGGGATGIDYLIDERLMVGAAIGYTNATHYLDGFDSRGTSDGYYAGIYGAFREGNAYFDMLGGYAYYDNRMRRSIAFPGFAARTAYGFPHANQYFGQIEAGYRFPGPRPGDFSITPFLRLQGMSTTQSAFTESGADSIDLSIAARTTNSVRAIPGVDLAGDVDLGWRSPLALQVRFGWAHEFIDDFNRPVTAAFVGAPTASFTVVGAVPPRDSAILGFNASTYIGRRTSAYLRYDGDYTINAINHAAAVGVRITW